MNEDKVLAQAYLELIRRFVNCIDSTGGVVPCGTSGLFAPNADPDWVDLGDVYFTACAALGHEPVIKSFYIDDAPGDINAYGDRDV